MSIDQTLRAIVREEIRAALAELRASMPSTAPSPWVRARDCGLPPTTRKRLTREGTIATSKIGRELYVSWADVESYIASQRIDIRQGDELDRRLRVVGKGAR